MAIDYTKRSKVDYTKRPKAEPIVFVNGSAHLKRGQEITIKVARSN